MLKEVGNEGIQMNLNKRKFTIIRGFFIKNKMKCNWVFVGVCTF